MEALGRMSGCPVPSLSLVSMLEITATASISLPVAARVSTETMGRKLLYLALPITKSHGSPS